MTSATDHQSQNTRLAAIVESSDDVIIAKDVNSVVQSWKRAAERLFGYSAAEIIGKPITIVFPLDRIEKEAVFLERIRRGETIEHHQTTRRHKDGKIITVSATVSPIRM